MQQMQSALEGFNASSERVRGLGGLHSALHSLTTPAIDSSDLLRAQIVLTVSALDYFVHEIVVLGMLETFQGVRSPTVAFNRQRVSGHLLLGARSAATFETDVRERHSVLSFQQPEKVADAVRLISEKPLWAEVSRMLGRTEQSVKAELKLIVERRNKIAHEADIDPSYPGARWPIVPQDTATALVFTEQVVDAIFKVVK